MVKDQVDDVLEVVEVLGVVHLDNRIDLSTADHWSCTCLRLSSLQVVNLINNTEVASISEEEVEQAEQVDLRVFNLVQTHPDQVNKRFIEETDFTTLELMVVVCDLTREVDISWKRTGRLAVGEVGLFLGYSFEEVLLGESLRKTFYCSSSVLASHLVCCLVNLIKYPFHE